MGEQTEDILAGAETREFGSAPADTPEHTIDDLLSELGDVESEVETLLNRVWDHVPMLAACEGPIDDVSGALDRLRTYLDERKKELKG